MSDVPTHLEAEVAEHERGNLDDDFDRRMNLYCDLIVARAIPGKLQAEVQQAIDDGYISPAGDRVGDEHPPFNYHA